MSSIRIAPSVLSADFTRLGEQVRTAEASGADWIHVDVMDGHFVPNLTMGPAVAAAVRSVTKLPMDVHLMIENPDEFLEPFARAGASTITVHQEVLPHLHRTLQRIRELGVRAGVAINPATPVETLSEVLPHLDLVLVMTVNPGFGGQAYIEGSEGKVGKVRSLLDHGGFSDVDLQVDGGIDAETIGRVVSAGATVAVAGSAIFNGSGDVAGNLYRLRAAAAVERSPLRRL